MFILKLIALIGCWCSTLLVRDTKISISNFDLLEKLVYHKFLCFDVAFVMNSNINEEKICFYLEFKSNPALTS